MQIHAGAVAPYQHKRLVTTADLRPPGVDLTQVSAAVIHVLREDGTETTWAATLEGAELVAGGSQVYVVHTYAADDVPDVGTLHCWIELTHVGGQYQTLGYRLNVVDRFAG